MKLPPASMKASYIRRDSSLGAPQPRSSPKVMVPRHNSDTRNPLCPNSLYRMDAPLLQMLQGLNDPMRDAPREMCHPLRPARAAQARVTEPPPPRTPSPPESP